MNEIYKKKVAAKMTTMRVKRSLTWRIKMLAIEMGCSMEKLSNKYLLAGIMQDEATIERMRIKKEGRH